MVPGTIYNYTRTIEYRTYVQVGPSRVSYSMVLLPGTGVRVVPANVPGIIYRSGTFTALL